MNHTNKLIVGIFCFFGVMLGGSCDREATPIGEHIYFQDNDCIIMGRGERAYDWGPGETTYRFFLLCKQGVSGDYGSDEFLVTSSSDLIKIVGVGQKIVSITYCPMFDILDPVRLKIRLETIMQQYPEEMHIDFNIAEDTVICEDAYGEAWREIEQSRISK